jgi:hypothetical protein
VIIAVPLHKVRSLDHTKSPNAYCGYHLIREIIDRGVVDICKVHMDLNIADPLMNALSQ